MYRSRKLIRGTLRRLFRTPGKSDLSFLALLWSLTALAAVIALTFIAPAVHGLPLSPGDRVQIAVTDGPEFTGTFHLDVDGAVPLPILGRVPLAGRELPEAERELATRLVDGGLFQPDFVTVTIQVLDWAPLEVSVSGAVFSPGRIMVNDRKPQGAVGSRRAEAPGAERPGRYLRDALRASGGVRPDADLARVTLIRAGTSRQFDLTGYVTGAEVPAVPLADGDRIVVPGTGRDDPALIRPSAVTPPGIKIFASNLVQPANSNSNANAPSSGISVPYGSRLSQAVVAANCAGGAASTNAGRTAILVRTDRSNGARTRWEAPISELLASATQTEIENPILMEGDSLYCADSTVTNLREFFRAITDVVLPFSLGRRL